MPRLRQFYPQNYATSQNISAEFESLVRYINSAEYGNKTLSELLAQIFDITTGDPDIPIDLRFDPTTGLQCRVGIFDNETDGWESIAAAADMRGTPGEDVGTIDSPILFNRQVFTGNGSNVHFTYALSADIDVLVFTSGLLQPTTAYTQDVQNQRVTFGVAPGNGANVTIMSYRIDTTAVYQRTDILAAASQVVFPFSHESGDTLLVYRNGILQRPGGSYDYVASYDADTITFMSMLNLNDVISIIRVDSAALRRVPGIMLAEDFVDSSTGLIPFNKITLADGAITQAKVSGLATALSTKAKLTVSGTTPVSAVTGDLWLNTGTTPNQLNFYNGSSWISTAPEQMLPGFTVANAQQYVRINATGTGYEYGEIDLSSYVLKSTKGQANGVAELNSEGVVPLAQIPDFYTIIPITYTQDGSVTNATKKVAKYYKTKVKLEAISAKLSAGTCTLNILVNGVSTGTNYSVTSTETGTVITPSVEIDASTTAKLLSITISNASTASDLEVSFAATALAV